MPGYQRMRLPEAYRVLLTLNARGFAWEWVRRNPDFRAIWAGAGAAARRSSELAQTAIRRSARTIIDLPEHPLARRWSLWGLTFRGRYRHAGNRGAADHLAAIARHDRSDGDAAGPLGTHDRRFALPAIELG
ncbi:transcriptional regulator domain-containing protein [Sphingomonas sp.]|uniref:transcriptional regulator domain-containing protein n=1 Tax=Sphingomonas sp. TaxID=28214 RepID=UPI003D6D3443